MPEKLRVLLVISGGIAATKTPDLIRRLIEMNCRVQCVLTESGKQFVTPMSLAALSKNKVYEKLFSLNDENEMGHINLTRSSDVVLVAPATANIIAKIANGFADDLATTTILASNKPLFVVPSMNVEMWEHQATQDNIRRLHERGGKLIGPENGLLACGETGYGRMASIDLITKTLLDHRPKNSADLKLKGYSVLVTSGPTQEPLDPVRFIGNHSSGKQGYAIANALLNQGAKVILISGPTSEIPPSGAQLIRITTAEEMLLAVKDTLPVDIAICVAAVADWKPKIIQNSKMKKTAKNTLNITLERNPDILLYLSTHDSKRPKLVIGFAAETDDILENSQRKLENKHCDWIVANDVSSGFGGDNNTVYLFTGSETEEWPRLSKTEVGTKLALKISNFLPQNK
ncbi:MAG: bifunctional phosphopantothenoylcysteine decarboxylase/phosphopantothenate--cysteine ligase CoaBC [Rhodospirillaceae bacterium]|nr:bifunctional phosphopantothenoylcysteine decarboxylase/phosphopantothenate--cysteine ligase CoaBC [Rhodospirillaceae bacterium]